MSQREHDLRLLPAALTAWAASLLGELSSASALWCVLAAGALGALGALRARRLTRTRDIALVVLIACAVGVLASAIALVRLDTRESSVLAHAARADGFVQVDGVVEQRPRVIQGSSDRAIVPLETTLVRWRGASSTEQVSVVILGDAGSWRDALPGTTVRVTGRAHSPDGSSSVVAMVIDSGASRISSSAPRWAVLAETIRDGLTAAAAVNDPDPAGLLVAMVDGDTSGISSVVQDEFRRSGLAHLLAVSGANVAIVVGVMLWIARLLRAPFALQIVCGALSLVTFIVIAGPEPSVLRAAGMGVVMLIALASGRPKAAIPALSSTVIVLVMWLPDLAISIGFVLSVLATAGIVLLGARWTDRWSQRMPRPCAAALAVAASAAISTLPVIVLLLPMVNIGSVLANVIAAPAVPFATVCGVAAAVCAPLLMPVAQFLCYVGGFAVRWIAAVARAASDADILQIPLPAGVLASAVVLAVILASAAIWRWARTRPAARTAFAGVLVGALVLSLPVRCVVTPWPPPGWVIAACDVGQGDAVLANAGDGAAVLFDAGPDPALIGDCLRQLGVQEISLVMLTHFHDDHVAGIPAVLGRMPVGRIVFGGYDGAQVEQSIRRLAAVHAVPVTEVAAGWTARVGDVEVAVVGPQRQIVGSTSDPNNNSLIARVEVSGVSMLITGDAQVEQEASMLNCACLRADVLKVPHHGSKNRDDGFFAATQASVALISVGRDNDYGHPAPSTVTELKRLGMAVRRTDREGTIILAVEDNELVVIDSREVG